MNKRKSEEENSKSNITKQKRSLQDIERYEDIIHLPHHVSEKHPQMTLRERAAQFAPFAALTGHGDVIRETEYRHVSDNMERVEYEGDI